MPNRQLLLKLHRWVGLALALLLAVQALTGMSLVFRDELEPVLHPELVVTPAGARASVQALVDTVRAARPDATLTRLEIPAAPHQAVLFKLKDHGAQRLTAVDPYTKRIVRDGLFTHWPLEWLFEIHEQLLAGDTGEILVGIEGVGLLFLAVAGLVVWWPGRKRLRQGFKMHLSAKPEPKWRSIHRAAGAGAALLLCLSAVTGALMVWKEPLRAALSAMVHVDRRPEPKVAARPGAAMLPLDELVRRAQAEAGGAPLRQIRFSSGGRVVAVFLDDDTVLRPDATRQVYFNAYDGTVLGRYQPREVGAAGGFIDWLYSVHIGLWGGVATKLVLLLTGLALFGLSVSGPWLWWKRESRRRRTLRERAAATSN